MEGALKPLGFVLEVWMAVGAIKKRAHSFLHRKKPILSCGRCRLSMYSFLTTRQHSITNAIMKFIKDSGP